MLRLFKNMKSHLHYVVIIILLLVVQAFCDLALPDYTSKIIDTGIQNSGIEHIAPEWISDDEYALAEIFMTDEEKSEWENLYTHIESDNRYEYVVNRSDVFLLYGKFYCIKQGTSDRNFVKSNFFQKNINSYQLFLILKHLNNRKQSKKYF